MPEFADGKKAFALGFPQARSPQPQPPRCDDVMDRDGRFNRGLRGQHRDSGAGGRRHGLQSAIEI